MLLRKMVAARKYANPEVSLITATLSVNIFGNWFLVATIATVNKLPIVVDFIIATTMANFVAFGCPAPSSFDTRTLHQN